MNKFPFQNLPKYETKAFIRNVTFYKSLVEKEFGLENIVKILYFSLPPLVSCNIHQDRCINKRVYEDCCTIFLLDNTQDVYFNTWMAVRPDKIWYEPGPTQSYPIGATPQLDKQHAILLSSTQLSSNIDLDITPWHNVENRSKTNRAELISVRFKHLIFY